MSGHYTDYCKDCDSGEWIQLLVTPNLNDLHKRYVIWEHMLDREQCTYQKGLALNGRLELTIWGAIREAI